MVKGVLFCDFGTVAEDISLDEFRVAPGFGFRVNMPALGVGAPLAFDFAFPVSSEQTDDEQVFSFYLGVLR
jgi:outer membrane protein insertion porin family